MERTGSEALFGIFPGLAYTRPLPPLPFGPDVRKCGGRGPYKYSKRGRRIEAETVGREFGALRCIGRKETKAKARWICVCAKCGSEVVLRHDALHEARQGCSSACIAKGSWE